MTAKVRTLSAFLRFGGRNFGNTASLPLAASAKHQSFHLYIQRLSYQETASTRSALIVKK